MIASRPSVYIYVREPDQRILSEICAGIEEEGVFYEVTVHTAGDIDTLAWNAAEDSMLGSGIGMIESACAFQIRGLKKGENVDFFSRPTKEEARRIGTNSARAVKKQAFKGI